MSSASNLRLAVLVIVLAAVVAGVLALGRLNASRRALASAPPAPPTPPLRVCADPNNLPFSNDRREGFENVLAEMLASDLGRPVQYTWWPQRRGFIRTTLRAGVCDVVMGVPTSFELARTTRPYYRSTYVFVVRGEADPPLTSLDDPRLRALTIGLHVVGDDYSNVPPAEALAARGLGARVRGYSIYGDYGQPNPPARLIEAVDKGDVDVAIAWGPIGGFFAGRAATPLHVFALEPVPELPFAFDISMGVRRDDTTLHDRLDAFIERRRVDIDRVLDQFAVPRIAEAAAVRTAGGSH